MISILMVAKIDNVLQLGLYLDNEETTNGMGGKTQNEDSIQHEIKVTYIKQNHRIIIQ